MRNAPHAIAAALLLAAAARLFAVMRHYGLLGLDTYPLLVQARVHSPGDVLALVSEPLLAGRFQAHFHRPLFVLSLAADEAFWGLDPLGYQITGALLTGACGALLYALARQLSPQRAAPALLALGAFLLHPILWEVVPAPSRRPDLLCLLFSLAALVAGGVRRGRPWPWVAALCGALALASKETALVLPAVGFGVAWLREASVRGRDRALRALRSVGPMGLAVLALLGWRIAVLGSVTGGRPNALEAPDSALAIVPRSMLFGLLAPERSWGAAPLLAMALAASGLALAVSAWRAPAARRAAIAAALRRPLAAAAVWGLGFGAVYVAAGSYQAWYGLLLLPALALGLAGLAAGSAEALQRESGRRGAALAGAAALGLAVAALAAISPLLRPPGDWAQASERAERYLASVGEAVRTTPDGGRAVLRRRPPLWIDREPGARRVQSAFVLSPPAVEAWATLAFPERRVRLAAPEGEPAADEVWLVLGPRRAR